MNRQLMGTTSVNPNDYDNISVVLSNENTLDTSIFTKGGTYFPSYAQNGCIVWTCSDPTYGSIVTNSILPNFIASNLPAGYTTNISNIRVNFTADASDPRKYTTSFTLPYLGFNITNVQTLDANNSAFINIGNTFENNSTILPVTIGIPRGAQGLRGNNANDITGGSNGQFLRWGYNSTSNTTSAYWSNLFHYGSTAPDNNIGNDFDFYVQYIEPSSNVESV